jgi:hypothetical protein
VVRSRMAALRCQRETQLRSAARGLRVLNLVNHKSHTFSSESLRPGRARHRRALSLEEGEGPPTLVFLPPKVILKADGPISQGESEWSEARPHTPNKRSDRRAARAGQKNKAREVVATLGFNGRRARPYVRRGGNSSSILRKANTLVNGIMRLDGAGRFQ